MAGISYCEQLHILVPDGLKARINEAAAREGVKTSEWLRQAIRERLVDAPDASEPPIEAVAR